MSGNLTPAEVNAISPGQPGGPASYQFREITVRLTIGTGTFGGSGANQVELKGLRVVASITKAVFPTADHALIRVYGVTNEVIQAVSTLGIVKNDQRLGNTVTLLAGDSVNGMFTVYSGAIYNAWQNFDEVPETCLEIIGIATGLYALQPAAPTSFSGTADVATVMAGLASQLGIPFENNGVSVQVSNCYLPGSVLDQVYELARMAQIEVYFDSGGGVTSPTAPTSGGQISPCVLVITPRWQSRGGQIPLISAATGLIGYPKARDNAMAFRCLFNPSLRVMGQIKVETTVGGGTSTQGGPNGYWYIASLAYDLSAQLPGGPWFCDVVCLRMVGPPA